MKEFRKRRLRIEVAFLKLFLLPFLVLWEGASSFAAVQSISKIACPEVFTVMSNHKPRGAIVVVAKCPIPGKSKTRLNPLLGAEGSAFLAKALLSDVLVTLSECVSLT